MGVWTEQDRLMARKWVEERKPSSLYDMRKFLLDKIKESSPSDRVLLDHRTDRRLWETWKDHMSLSEDDKANNKYHANYGIPSDIIFANTIPLRDCEIWIDETDAWEQGTLVKYRVVIFDQFEKILSIIKKFEEESVFDDGMVQPIPVGALIIDLPNSNKFYSPFHVVYGFDYVIALPEDMFIMHPDGTFQTAITMSEEKLLMMGHEYLSTWYSIQISLLHPQIKNLYKVDDPREKNLKKKPSKRTKRKTKLIRRMYLNEDDVEQVLKPTKDVSWKTLVWYVCGHFRHYKSGKVIFIQPYWKGVLRDVKRNLDEGRDREIAV